MEPPNLDKTVSTELTNFPTETVINTANQIFPDTIVSNNASIPEEIMEEDVPNVRILTRGFAQRVSLGIPLTIPKLKRGTLSEKKSSSIRTRTCVNCINMLKSTLPFRYTCCHLFMIKLCNSFQKQYSSVHTVFTLF